VDHELIATCWTHAGDARPLRGDERSPLPIEHRIAAAAATGWQGIGFVLTDLRIAEERLGLDRVRGLIADAGLSYTEVELAVDWWKADAVSTESREFLVRAARTLGARSIKAAGSMHESPPAELMASALRRLAEQAEPTGAFVALEPFPFSNIRTVPFGAELVEAAGHANLGLIVDVWHVFRAGTTLEELRRSVPPRFVRAVELDDASGPIPTAELLFDDTADHRRLPGRGDFDLVGFVRLMKEFGYHGPWGVEIISEEHRALPVEEALRQAAEATRAVLEMATRPGAARLAPPVEQGRY